MIFLTYKEKKGGLTRMIPSRSMTEAKLRADKLYEKGYYSVKVYNVEEIDVYVPAVKQAQKNSALVTV